jgi:hypothetical protein
MRRCERLLGVARVLACVFRAAASMLWFIFSSTCSAFFSVLLKWVAGSFRCRGMCVTPAQGPGPICRCYACVVVDSSIGSVWHVYFAGFSSNEAAVG